jgi:Protein of unknown function (DUF3551)
MQRSPATAAGIFAGTFAAVIFANQPASAQSAYSYPWCARYPARLGATSCYFTSWQQCQTTISGIGGYCFQSPYYHGSALAKRGNAVR